jgi:hypothetical protein
VRVEVAGLPRPAAVVYGERMTAWLARLAPEASEHLAIAVRGQHVRRFDVPRSTYPMDKPGYFAWRNALKRHHAEVVGAIMANLGYAEADVGRVGAMIRKEGIKRDPETQTLEDCACLVFLEFESVEFLAKYPDDKIVDIVAKTWAKMSEVGHAQALELVPLLPERLRALVVRAVTGG